MAPSMGFASKLMGGNTNNKKDSAGRRHGIKKWGHTTEIYENDIIARQKGTKWMPGYHTRMGKDFTIHSKIEGSLVWSRDKYTYRQRARAHVIPMEQPNRRFPKPPPFVYHPELFPQLAQNNPEPRHFDKKGRVAKPRVRFENKFSAVENPSRFVLPSTMTPQVLNAFRQQYYFKSQEAADKLSDFQEELQEKSEGHFLSSKDYIMEKPLI